MTDAPNVYAFRRDLVLAASAGTGKTHALVGVLVHALLGASELGGAPHAAIDPARVVATTFSRKAAAEIRARVALALERLASGDPRATYRADLDEACARAGSASWDDAELARRAHDALARLPSAQIGTLHGFAGSLVRAYAFERGLSPSFEIADEEESRARAEEAIARAIERLAATNGPDLAEIAAAAGGVERLVLQITRALGRLEEDGRGARSLVVATGDAHDIESRVAAVADHARGLAGAPRFEAAARELGRAWAARDAGALEAALEALCSVRRSPKGGTVKEEEWFAYRDAFLAGDTAGEKGRNLAKRWAMRDRFATSATFARDLFVACEEELRAVTAQSGALAYGDLLREARDLLRDRPDIAAEVGASLDVLLVDEFQDTSRLQRDLLLLVWQKDPRSRAAGTLPTIGGVRPHGLLVVGDRKQSIYSFRGADVGVFAELCVGLAGAPARRALGIESGVAWEPETPIADFWALRHNRRGEPELLAMANELSARRFRPSAPAEIYEIAYQPHTEDLLPPPGRAHGEPIARTTWLRVPAQKSASSPQDEAAAIAHHVARIVREGEPLVRGEPPRWRDVAVLAETNRALDHVAFALTRAGVPCVVAGSGFYNAREVRDLVAMLALLVDSSDAWAILEVLRGPWCGVRDETLLALTDRHAGLVAAGEAWGDRARAESMHEGDLADVARVREVVTALHDDLDRLGPGRALREAVRALELEEVLVRLPRGAQRVANVRKLLAIADREPRAPALLERLHDAAEREVSEGEAATFSEEDDAVRLLTVHASKGLDFPIVFVPEIGKAAKSAEREAFLVSYGSAGAPSTIVARAMGDDGRAHDGPSYEHAITEATKRARAERQRLAYVASTRASHAMIFVGDRSMPQKGESEAYSSTTAAAIRLIADSPEARARAWLAVEDAPAGAPAERTAEGPPAAPVAPAAHSPAGPAPRAGWRALPIATTALQDFHHCARRFELAHVLDLPEQAPAFAPSTTRDASSEANDAGDGPRLDARAEGTLAHRALEQVDPASFGRPLVARAEVSRALERAGVAASDPKHAAVLARVSRFLSGAYAGRIAAESAAIEREAPFAIDVRDPEGRTVVLRGAIDLLVRWRDGGIDVIDYKRARGPSPEPHAFQLDAYVLAVRARAPEATRIRAGIVFLGGDGGEPAWRAPIDVDSARARLAALGSRLVEARWTERFPREPIATCRAIRCGYVRHCHPETPPPVPLAASEEGEHLDAQGVS